MPRSREQRFPRERERRAMEKLLRVETRHFVAGAVFEKKDGAWRLQRCAPILKWMRAKDPKAIAEELTRRGFKWAWL